LRERRPVWPVEDRLARDDRSALRHPSDLSDQEWSSVSPLIPSQGRDGRPRKVELREVLNALLYVLATECPWRSLPPGFPPRSTVHFYYKRWGSDGTLIRVRKALFAASEDRSASERRQPRGRLGRGQ
jgi:transposase